jgi:CRISPR-associated protein Csm4
MKALDKSQRIRQAKDFKRLKWMIVGADLRIDLGRNELMDDRGLAGDVVRASKVEVRRDLQKVGIGSFCEESPRQHNTINRDTGTTGKGPFAPFVTDCTYYHPGATLSVFALIDEEVTSGENVSRAMENIGKFGFGKDASTGMGRFAVEGCKEITIPPADGANACYCLGPCVPEQGSFDQAYFVPFVRFGKHGDALARSRNPFKNPVIMADEGAVFFPRDGNAFHKPFIGRGITGLSKSCESTVTQGFAPYLPIRVEI